MTVIAAALFAFIGSVIGVFISNDLDTVRKRREVRRSQIEKFAEALTDDEYWLQAWRRRYVTGDGKGEETIAPYERARAIVWLYFQDDMANLWTVLSQARHDYYSALHDAYSRRLKDATAAQTPLAVTPPDEGLMANIQDRFTRYYAAQCDCLFAASAIAQDTIPKRAAVLVALDSARTWLTRGVSPRASRIEKKPPEG